jgi:hypothetical protein
VFFAEALKPSLELHEREAGKLILVDHGKLLKQLGSDLGFGPGRLREIIVGESPGRTQETERAYVLEPESKRGFPAEGSSTHDSADACHD